MCATHDIVLGPRPLNGLEAAAPAAVVRIHRGAALRGGVQPWRGGLGKALLPLNETLANIARPG